MIGTPNQQNTQRQKNRERQGVSPKHFTIYLSMQLGNKLKVNMCGEYSGRKTLLNWRMSLPLLQLIPIRGIPQPQNKGALPGSQQVCSEIPMEAECLEKLKCGYNWCNPTV